MTTKGSTTAYGRIRWGCATGRSSGRRSRERNGSSSSAIRSPSGPVWTRSGGSRTFSRARLGTTSRSMNAGVCGWGTDQELLYYETRARDLRSRHRDPHVHHGERRPQQHARPSVSRVGAEAEVRPRRGQSRPREENPRTAPARVSNAGSRNALRGKPGASFSPSAGSTRSATSRASSTRARRATRGFDREGLEKDYSHWSVYESSYGPQFEAAWRVTEAIVRRFARDCADDGAELLVFAFPLKLDVDEDWRSELIRHFCYRLDAVRFRETLRSALGVLRRTRDRFRLPTRCLSGKPPGRGVSTSTGTRTPISMGTPSAAGCFSGDLHRRARPRVPRGGADRGYLEPASAPTRRPSAWTRRAST